MTLERLLLLIKDYRNGSYVRLAWQSEYYNAKGHKVTKHSSAKVRLGVAYSHIASADPKGEGLAGEQEWVGPYLIKNNKTGRILLRVTKAVNSNSKAEAYYTDENGATYEKPSYIDFLPPSKKEPRPNPSAVFNIFLDNLVSIGGKK